jgi:hypothetical protein
MLVGFALFERLPGIAPCIEVFPNAIAHALRCYLHKSKPGGVEAQLRAAAKHTGWPDSAHQAVAFADIAWCPSHDRLDAYLSAWVASLPEKARSAYGDRGKDAIWVPNLENPAAFPDATHPVYQVASSDVTHTECDAALPDVAPAVHDPSLSRSCPACNTKLFKRWPWGWDGHAAVCSGLAGGDLEVRKAEFKRRFLVPGPADQAGSTAR